MDSITVPLTHLPRSFTTDDLVNAGVPRTMISFDGDDDAVVIIVIGDYDTVATAADVMGAGYDEIRSTA